MELKKHNYPSNRVSDEQMIVTPKQIPAKKEENKVEQHQQQMKPV